MMWIQFEIHKKAFCEFITSFPCFIHRLYDEGGILGITGIDHRVEVTRIADVSLIKDNVIPIVLHRAQPFTLGLDHFEERLLYRLSMLIS